jgi:photosynthetic reaction center cytochrome c subunit
MRISDERACRILAALAISAALAHAQPAEQVFKNVRMLKGISVDQFMATMGFFSASLGETCTDCHSAESGGSWARYADDNPRKNKARAMIGMMNAINKTYFGGKREITCYSCHRGVERPDVTPNLADLYGPPPSKEPDELREPVRKTGSADQVLAKYIQAVGGTERVSALAGFIAKGTYQGYQDEKYPVDLYAQAPDRTSIVIHTAAGESITTYDGQAGWIAGPATERPVPLIELTGGDLIGAKLDAAVWFPSRLRDTLMQWRDEGSVTIDGRDMQMLQGTADGRFPVNLYFDGKTVLLARLVRYNDSPVGLAPTQVDYSDYRDVNGVELPYRVMVTWLDGKSDMQLSEIRPNVPIDAAQFQRPAPQR